MVVVAGVKTGTEGRLDAGGISPRPKVGGREEYVMGNSITRLSKCSCPIALLCPNGYQQSVVRGVLVGLPKGGPRLALASAHL